MEKAWKRVIVEFDNVIVILLWSFIFFPHAAAMW